MKLNLKLIYKWTFTQFERSLWLVLQIAWSYHKLGLYIEDASCKLQTRSPYLCNWKEFKIIIIEWIKYQCLNFYVYINIMNLVSLTRTYNLNHLIKKYEKLEVFLKKKKTYFKNTNTCPNLNAWRLHILYD